MEREEEVEKGEKEEVERGEGTRKRENVESRLTTHTRNTVEKSGEGRKEG